MTTIKFRLRMHPGSQPGMAVGTIWPAFATERFKVQHFTLAFGGNDEPARQLLAAGEYWVQLKLPTGEIVKEIVKVPGGAGQVTVTLTGTGRVSDSLNEEPSVRSQPQINPPYAAAVNPIFVQGDLRIPRGAFERRGMGLILKSRRPPIGRPHPTEAVEHLEEPADRPSYFSFPEIGAHQFTLSFLRRRMPEWPRRRFAIAGPAKLPAASYFDNILRSRDRTAMSIQVEGNSISSSLRDTSETDYLGQANAPRAILRDFALLEDSRHKQRLLIGVPRRRGGQATKLIVRPDHQDAKRLVRLSIEVEDPKFNSMLQFIKGSDIGSAISVAESSLSILYAKFDNPLAAAAAGYVLIQAPPDTIQVPWEEWIGNLGRYFPDLPDGKILHATLLLQRGDTGTPVDFYEDHSQYFPLDRLDRNLLAASLLLDSLTEGPPIFRAGLALLATNLRILASVDLPEETRSMLHEAGTLVTWLSMKVDPREPFCIFRLN